MKRLLALFISVVVICLTSNAQSVTALNNLFSTYSQNIKVCNPHWYPDANSCIYDTHYMKAELQDNCLVLSFGFSWDEKLGYISKDVLRINLTTATFYTGYWTNYSGKWGHYGKKEVLAIKDDNGMDEFSTGQQNYNQGTKQTLLSEFYISFGTEPIANRVINEIYKIQERYKAKEPWLLPEPVPQKEATTPLTKNTSKKQNNNKPSVSNTPKKVGKYVQ